jgi:hypothetical protein
MKNVLLICGRNIPACQSMAVNLKQAGYAPADIAAFTPDAGLLDGCAGIGNVRILRRKAVMSDAAENGAFEAGESFRRSFDIFLEKKYDLSVNTGLSRSASALQGFVASVSKAGVFEKDGKTGYNGLWYFYDMAVSGKVYLSGAYNDISFYNSLLLGHVDGLYDHAPVFEKGAYTERFRSGALVMSRAGTPGALDPATARASASLLEKDSIPSAAVQADPGRGIRMVLETAPMYLVTDSPSAAGCAAAAGSAVVYVHSKQHQCGYGPVSKRSLTIRCRPTPQMIADAVNSLRQESGFNENKWGNALAKQWEPGVNPFLLIEKEISSYFGKYERSVSAPEIFSDAGKFSGPTAAKLEFYSHISGVNVLADELAKGAGQ